MRVRVDGDAGAVYILEKDAAGPAADTPQA
jgi:hypothetical protein